MDALEKAIDVCGGAAKLADRIGVSPQYISQMRKRRRPVPPGRCLAIQDATRGCVTVHDLRPDVFGPSKSVA